MSLRRKFHVKTHGEKHKEMMMSLQGTAELINKAVGLYERSTPGFKASKEELNAVLKLYGVGNIDGFDTTDHAFAISIFLLCIGGDSAYSVNKNRLKQIANSISQLGGKERKDKIVTKLMSMSEAFKKYLKDF